MPEIASEIIDMGLLVAFVAFCWSVATSLRRIAARLEGPPAARSAVDSPMSSH